MVATSIWCVALKVNLDFHVSLIAMLRVEVGRQQAVGLDRTPQLQGRPERGRIRALRGP